MLLNFLKLTISHGRKNILLAILLTIINTFVGLVAISSLAPLINLLISENQPNNQLNEFFNQFLNLIGLEYNFYSSIALFCTLLISSLLTNILLNYAILRLKYNLIFSITENSIGKILNADITFLFKKNYGEIQNTFVREIDKISNSLTIIIRSFSNIFLIISFFIFILILDFKISSIIFLSMGSFFLILTFFKNYFLNLGALNTQSGNRIISSLVETLSQFKIIKILEIAQNRLKTITNNFKIHQTTTIKFQMINLSIPYAVQIVALVSIFLIFFIEGKNISLSTLSVILLALQRIASPLSQVASGKIYLDIFSSAYLQLQSITKDADLKYEKISGDNISNIQSSIKINNLRFIYDQNLKGLKDLNFEFFKGKLNVIKGRSGSGKTTLVDIILGLLNPSSGGVYIDGKNLDNINLQKYRSLISYLPQDVKLFNMSVKENILIGSQGYHKEKMNETLKLSALGDIDNILNNGLLTEVGEMGTEISGGQRQRILLARAIYRTLNSGVLILDEPTSALDAQNQNIIIEALKKLKQKVLLIVSTHDRRILALSDNILDLSNYNE